jgi:alcohol dehydrogenase class IV
VKQRIIEGSASYRELGEALRSLGMNKYMLAYSNSAKKLPVWEYISELDIPRVLFSDFTPNPKYEEIVGGVDLFRAEKCDGIVAIGGGSAIDVAKCIKLYSKMSADKLYLEQEYTDTGVPLVALPTTAGTGSESTPFSVIYYKGEKQSVKHPSILPDVAILDGDVLESLPVYQKKCTVLDAYCQAIEAWWSVNSCDESKACSKAAIELIRDYIFEYVEQNTCVSRHKIMAASNLAGQAIAFTATTAPHAMSYKLTTTYGYPHGHSVAISLPRVWKYMIENHERCNDKRGADYVLSTFDEIANAMGYATAKDAAEGFENMLSRLEMAHPHDDNKEEIAKHFASFVNVERLGNNPIALDNKALYDLYLEMFI